MANIEEEAAPHNDSVIAHVSHQEISYSGPVPHPELFREYEAILPGAAERILAMAEAQAAHRQRLESEVIRGDVARGAHGLYAGFIVAMTIAIGGMVVGVKVDPWAGAAMVGTTLASLVGVFVYGTVSRKSEREGKSQTLAKHRRGEVK